MLPNHDPDRAFVKLSPVWWLVIVGLMVVGVLVGVWLFS